LKELFQARPHRAARPASPAAASQRWRRRAVAPRLLRLRSRRWPPAL